MVATAVSRGYDFAGHNRDLEACYGSGFAIATSGTAAGTVVPNTTGAGTAFSASVTEPYGASDSNGLVQLTTGTGPATGTVLVVYFKNAYPYVPTGASVTISTTAGVAVAGVVTNTVTNTSLTVTIATTALTATTTYLVRYTIAG